MNVQKIAKSKRLLTGCIAVLITLMFFVKAESSLYAPIEHQYYSSPIEIELVVAAEIEYDLDFFQLHLPSYRSPHIAAAPLDFAARNKFALQRYESYVRHQLKIFEHAFPTKHQLLAILQNQNIWHRSSGEEPFCG